MSDETNNLKPTNPQARPSARRPNLRRRRAQRSQMERDSPGPTRSMPRIMNARRCSTSFAPSSRTFSGISLPISRVRGRIRHRLRCCPQPRTPLPLRQMAGLRRKRRQTMRRRSLMSSVTSVAPQTPPSTSASPPPQIPAGRGPLDFDAPTDDHERVTFPLIGGPPDARTELLQSSCASRCAARSR